MKRLLICTGVLGGGTAITFAAAVLAASLAPNGSLVPMTNVNQPLMAKPMMLQPAMPAPMPAIPATGGGFVVGPAGGTTVTIGSDLPVAPVTVAPAPSTAP